MSGLLKKADIIIVDDNPKNLQLLGTLLKRQGYQVGVARDGSQALKAIRQVKPDLVLLDIMMPGMDGFEVCRQLKEAEETAAIPIIFLSARTESEDIVKGFELGAVDYIMKPFNMQELLVRVNTHLELNFSRKKLEKQKHELNELIHILSHDLSNPLQAISLYIEMAALDNDVPDPDYLYSLTKHCIAIVKLVKSLNFLDERGSELVTGRVDLGEAVEQSLQIMDCYLKQKELTVELAIEADTVVIAERSSLINTVINNIVSNAIKFSYRGSSISFSSTLQEEWVMLTISDKGVGIPESLMAKLFTVGVETTRLGTAGERGTGFGMALVQKFMTAYDGRIELESRVESSSSGQQGTTVRLYFRTKSLS